MCYKLRLRHSTCGHRGDPNEAVWRFCRRYGVLKRNKPRPCHRYDSRQAPHWRTADWCCSRSCCESAKELNLLYEDVYHATRELQQAELDPRRNKALIKERREAFEEAVRAIDHEKARHERCARKRKEYLSEGAQYE
ncbi:hypothetical protein LTR56_003149 [Elasticomyces elasticus]|nr:hypothetical protein LTR22_010682 [Elasticomyces elasticus]KAK3656018.1 hypothetical protein LTR56_003149 [Elasticomyces elasticus]KAK4920920.1 hypothetical protein LTR49_011643 [Elasticomyces elasticus]KAK5759564.1 hypothetical protein LTS12_010256 [Elasticomyces elasticus]